MTQEAERSLAECEGALVQPLSAVDLTELLLGAQRCGRVGDVLQLLARIYQQPDQAAGANSSSSAGARLARDAAPPLLPRVQQLVQQLKAAVPRGGGGAPSLGAPLLRVLSPVGASVEVLRALGKGGFGSVCAVRSRLDGRVFALKRVPFQSAVPPWAPLELLEAAEHRTLREARVLASLSDGCPHVVRYHSAWLEADWAALARRVGGSARRRAGRSGRRLELQHQQQPQQMAAQGLGQECGQQGPCLARRRAAAHTSSGAGGSSSEQVASAARRRGRKGRAQRACIVTEVTSGGSEDTAGAAGSAGQQPRGRGAAAGAWLHAQAQPVRLSTVVVEELPSSSADAAVVWGGDHGADASTSNSTSTSTSTSSSTRTSSSSSSRSRSRSRSRGRSTSRSGGSSGSSDSSSGRSDPIAGADLPSCSHCSAFTFGEQSALTANGGTGQNSDASSTGDGSSSGSRSSGSSGSSESENTTTSSSSGGDDVFSGRSAGVSSTVWALVPRAQGPLAGPGPGSPPPPPWRRLRRRRASSSSADDGGGPLWAPPRAAPLRGRGPGGGSQELASAAVASWPYVLNVSMELVEGPTLLDWMRHRTAGGADCPPPGAAELRLFRQILEGLAFVHARGVIHRDLKPANVLLAKAAAAGGPAGSESSSSGARRSGDDAAEWCVKLADFGLATVAGVGGEQSGGKLGGGSSSSSSSSSSSVDVGSSGGSVGPRDTKGQGRRIYRLSSDPSTLHTSGVGTASYAAPEQLEGGSGGYSSAVDLFSAGLILMELFCRFETGMERAVAFADARAHRALPDVLSTEHPAAAALVWRLLDPDPSRRPTARQLLDQSPLLQPGPAVGLPRQMQVEGRREEQDEEHRRRVLYDGEWHDAQSLLRLLHARDEQIALLRAEVVALQKTPSVS